MNQQAIEAPSLFDLLSRHWQRPSPVSDLCFAGDGSAVAFSSLDGSIAIAATADREPPESRVRTSADVGRTTISPRTAPPAPLIAPAALGEGKVALAAYLKSDFLVGTGAGDVVHLKADGEVAGTPMSLGEPILAIDHCAVTGATAAATGTGVFLSRGAGAPLALGHGSAASRVAALAFSPDGGTLAVARHGAGEGADEAVLSLWNVDDPALAKHNVAVSGRPVSIRWNADGSFLAMALEAGGFALVRLADGQCGIIGGYPSPVGSLCWNSATGALVTSGAYRAAGWSMRAPPFDGDLSGAMETGRAGVVLIETVAAHPDKKLVASGYANGQIAIAEIGGRDELLVRPWGGAVTALSWSGDGRHLAAGAADGTAAIVTFPPQMFK